MTKKGEKRGQRVEDNSRDGREQGQAHTVDTHRGVTDINYVAITDVLLISLPGQL